MTTLAALNSQAHMLSGQRGRLGPDVLRTQLDALRAEAAQSGHGPAFDNLVRTLFADVYDHKPLPPAKLTRSGHAQDVTAGGSKGAALQFHTLRNASPNEIVASVKRRVPELTTTTTPPLSVAEHFAPLGKAEKAQAMADLKDELSKFMVIGGPNDARVKLLDKFEKNPVLSSEQKQRILECLAEVKFTYARAGETLEQKLSGKPGGRVYQDVNWKHTRIELDRVLDVCMQKGLSARDTETAILASMFSDSVKTPNNFLVHNVHGAEGALTVLSRMQPPMKLDQIEDIVRAALEHQIGPPRFMALMVMAALDAAGVAKPLLGSIKEKIEHPFASAQGGGQVVFTPAEREALQKVGILAWTVPQEGTRHYGASRAVIDGDSLVNYACPDGWGKIAALNGPGTPPFLQSRTFEKSVNGTEPDRASALKSFEDAKSVISPEILPAYEAGLARTRKALATVMDELRMWVKWQPDVPLTKDGKIPYLDAPLDYDDAAQVAFARALRDQGVSLLRLKENV